jgi:hypothetical protein
MFFHVKLFCYNSETTSLSSGSSQTGYTRRTYVDTVHDPVSLIFYRIPNLFPRIPRDFLLVLSQDIHMRVLDVFPSMEPQVPVKQRNWKLREIHKNRCRCYRLKVFTRAKRVPKELEIVQKSTSKQWSDLNQRLFKHQTHIHDGTKTGHLRFVDRLYLGIWTLLDTLLT